MLCLLASACESALPPTVGFEPTDIPIETTNEANRLELTLHGVEIGINVPIGWVTDVQDGLILAEHTPRFEAADLPVQGLMLYLFVPALDQFTIPPEMTLDHNMAQIILDQVMEMPTLVGDASVSAPTAFVWGAHKAAFYLLTNDNQTQTIVLAIALPDQQQLVVCNISAPTGYGAEKGGLRAALPILLDGLTINGVTLDGARLLTMTPVFDFPPAPPL